MRGTVCWNVASEQDEVRDDCWFHDLLGLQTEISQFGLWKVPNWTRETRIEII